MTMSSRNKSKDLVAAMRHTVSRAVGVAGLTVAVSLPAAGVQASENRNHTDVANSLHHVQQAIKAVGSKMRAFATGEKMAWGNWQNWNNWRNY